LATLPLAADDDVRRRVDSGGDDHVAADRAAPPPKQARCRCPPEAKKRSVTLRAIGTQQPLLVRADSVHLQQVILNLARNGMDAMITMAPDTRMMTIRTALLGESTVEVSVSDTGTGVPEHKLSEIFDTFYTTKEHGTGLGLSIARTIVETYGGKISAENRAGGGAVFRFTPPLIRRSPQRDRLAPSEAQLPFGETAMPKFNFSISGISIAMAVALAVWEIFFFFFGWVGFFHFLSRTI
jgi:hypothetical protein